MRLTHVLAATLTTLALQMGTVVTAGAQLLDAKVISLEAAQKMLSAADAEARKNGWTVSIAIVDAAGTLIAFQRMDNASLISADVAVGKARTAARMRRPTKALDSLITTGRVHYLAFDGIMPLEGGLPISYQGKIIGGIAASGATSAQDAQIAAAGITTLVP
ncbi:MAG: heme-binding protein [Gemmatimonadaceae bacterium]